MSAATKPRRKRRQSRHSLRCRRQDCARTRCRSPWPKPAAFGDRHRAEREQRPASAAGRPRRAAADCEPQQREQMQRENRDQRHAEPGRVGIALDRRERRQNAGEQRGASRRESRSRGARSRIAQQQECGQQRATAGNVAIAIRCQRALCQSARAAAAFRAHGRARSRAAPASIMRVGPAQAARLEPEERQRPPRRRWRSLRQAERARLAATIVRQARGRARQSRPARPN